MDPTSICLVDGGALVLGHRAADRQEPWRVGALTHRTVEGIDLAAVILEGIEQKDLVKIVEGEAGEKAHLFRQDSKLDTSANFGTTEVVRLVTSWLGTTRASCLEAVAPAMDRH
jgi:hypothetical protein